MGAQVTRCSGNATGAQHGAYSRVCGASTAFRPVAVGVGGAERGAPMSQRACSRFRGASTAKGAAQRGCSATGPTPRATGSLSRAMHEIVFLLVALTGIGLLGYLVTILTPHVFHNIGLVMLLTGLVEGIPTGFWYHVVLRRILIQRGNLPRKWWIHPTRHHGQLTPEEHRRIRLWFVLGGIGYTIAVTGGLAAIVGLLIERL